MPEAVPGAVAERLGQAVTAERVARRRVDVEPRRARADRGDRPIVRLENRAVHLAGPRASLARSTPSGSGRRSMSRRRRQSPARRGRLRSIFARRGAREAARRSARWRQSSRTPAAEPALPNAPVDGQRQLPLGHPGADLAEDTGRDGRQPPRRLAQRRDLVARPSELAPARRSLRSARASIARHTVSSAERTESTTHGGYRQVSGFEPDAACRQCREPLDEHGVVRPFHRDELEPGALTLQFPR